MSIAAWYGRFRRTSAVAAAWYGAPEKDHDQDIVWIAGAKELHPFKWISKKDEHGPAQGKDEIAIPHSIHRDLGSGNLTSSRILYCRPR